MATAEKDIPRTQRRDAVRNRAKVLDAARAQFAEKGLETQIEEIARRAGVGVGTVYRHFPTKEALLEALAIDRFESLAAAAREGLDLEDPWEGLVRLMRFGARLMAEDRALSEAMEQLPGICGPAAESSGLDALTDELVARAQAAGELRPDIVGDDIGALVCGLGRSTRTSGEGPVMSWERYLEILLDGLRAPRR
jgi:AcrR family transcriptional regulator